MNCNENLSSSETVRLKNVSLTGTAPAYNRQMRSMTGYGSGSADAPTHQLTLLVEITSVNRKALDLNVSSPREWTGLEQKCAEWIKGQFERGRLNVIIKVQSLKSSSHGMEWNEPLLEKTLNQIQEFANRRKIPMQADGALILQIAQSLQEKTGLPDWRELEDLLKKAIDQALTDLNSMREQEGQALKKDLLARLTELESLHQDIATHAGGTTARYQSTLLERISLLGLELDLNDERLLKEIALFADRCDISEELTRLGSHFEQFRSLAQTDAAVGRKMDFLCQEIHREFNTIGSKASQIEITRAVIECKNELERIREQVQNVE